MTFMRNKANNPGVQVIQEKLNVEHDVANTLTAPEKIYFFYEAHRDDIS